MLIRRRGGLEVMSDDPPLHKAIKIQSHKYEIYSSYAAMGKMALIRNELLKQISRKKDAINRWKTARVLVIDEISMLDGRLFEDLEAVARQIRRSTAFFGGIQLILSGDFFQLPPVGRRVRGQGEESAPAPPQLCFESNAWPNGGSDSDDAIHIFSHNDDVLRTNTRAIDELGGKKFNYLSADRGKTEFLTKLRPVLERDGQWHVQLVTLDLCYKKSDWQFTEIEGFSVKSVDKYLKKLLTARHRGDPGKVDYQRKLTQRVCGTKADLVKRKLASYREMPRELALPLQTFNWEIHSLSPSPSGNKGLYYVLLDLLQTAGSTKHKNVLVLVMGDGALGGSGAEQKEATKDLLTKFLDKNWHVEIHSWLHALNDWFLDMQECKQYQSRITVKPLDDAIHDLVYLKQDEEEKLEQRMKLEDERKDLLERLRKNQEALDALEMETWSMQILQQQELARLEQQSSDKQLAIRMAEEEETQLKLLRDYHCMIALRIYSKQFTPDTPKTSTPMRIGYVTLLATTAILASFGNVSGDTDLDHTQVAKVASLDAVLPINTNRFLRRRENYDDEEAATEERSAFEALAAKLDKSVLPAFLKIANQYPISLEKRLDILALHGLSKSDRKKVLLLIQRIYREELY
eukprot:jgi/Phyca11/15088/fgenesh1_pg.PHYCAscaffold_11_\